jgi:hypothetical protein
MPGKFDFGFQFSQGAGDTKKDIVLFGVPAGRFAAEEDHIEFQDIHKF